jgi:hypothetical protein
VIIERDGVFVRDENGKIYLESPIWIVVRQPGFLNDVGIVLAKKLLSIAPVPVSKAFFVNAATGRPRRKSSAAVRRTTALRSPAQVSPDCRTITAISICRSPISCMSSARIGIGSRSPVKPRRRSPAAWPLHWSNAF